MRVKRRGSKRKKDRDINLLTDYNRGLLVKELVKKYNISSARIYQILKRFENEN